MDEETEGKRFSAEGETQGGLSEYRIDREREVVMVRFVGTLTACGIGVYTAALRSDPEFDPNFAEIVDLRAVQSVEITPEQAMCSPIPWTRSREFPACLCHQQRGTDA